MTYIETLVFGLLSFIFKLIGITIEFMLMALLIYGVIYAFLRFAICWKDPDGWEVMACDLRSGVKDAIEAFKDVMPAVKMSAKQWAREKLEELRR